MAQPSRNIYWLISAKELSTFVLYKTFIPIFIINTLEHTGEKVCEKIKQVANVMADSNYHYMVVGFADSIGSVEYNMQLAEKRAKAVSEELIKYGVKAEQITVQSVGKNEPFGDPGSRVNRKVSFYREIE